MSTREEKIRDLAYRVGTASLELEQGADGAMDNINFGETIDYLEAALRELKELRAATS
jgi:hypothetical protein